MSEFRMPSLGADMTEGKLLEWLVSPGDPVHRGDVVAVVDTEKAEMDVESFEDGVVERLLVEPGSVVPVGGPLAVFAAAATAATATAPATPARVPAQASARTLSPPLRRLADRLGVDPATVVGTGARGKVTRADVEAAARATAPEPAAAPGRPRVSPRARKLAVELGVDVSSVAGTGAHGAVVADDVRRASEAEGARRAPEAPTGQADRGAAMRRAIGALMARSKREVPHYYLSTTIDLAAVTATLTARNADRPVSHRLVHAAFLLKAAALAARKVPAVNGFWLDDGFVPAEHVNLGVAVNLRTGGLVAPALLDADLLSVDDLMAALRDLVARARAGRLRRREMTDGTLTVTNLGDRGVEAVFGVIYPPQVALVGFGRVVDRPVAVDGLIGVRPAVTATLSADHRATDGHVGGLYLSALESLLTRPEEL